MPIIIIISLILYFIVANSIYHAMPEIKKEKKLIYIIIGFFLLFLITYILTNLSAQQASQIEEEKLSIAKRTAIYLMAPINSFILMPIGRAISKCKEKKLTKEKLKKRIAVIIFLFILCLILEKSYIQNFIQGLLVSGT